MHRDFSWTSFDILAGFKNALVCVRGDIISFAAVMDVMDDFWTLAIEAVCSSLKGTMVLPHLNNIADAFE